MNQTAIVIGLGLALVVGGAAMADGGKRAQKMFDRLDVNGDGRITQEEAQGLRDQRFARMDANGDGRVTLSEMQDAGRKRRAERMAKRFEKMDANGDGSLARSEYEDLAVRRFQRMDANGDGALTLDEIKARRHRKGG